MSGRSIHPSLVDELLEPAIRGDFEVITSGVRHRGPREVVVREVALENLTVLRSEQLSRSGGKLVRLRGHGALSVHERAEVTVHGDLLAFVAEVYAALENLETGGAFGLDLHAELGSADEGRGRGRGNLEAAIALCELFHPGEDRTLVQLDAGRANFATSRFGRAVGLEEDLGVRTQHNDATVILLDLDGRLARVRIQSPS